MVAVSYPVILSRDIKLNVAERRNANISAIMFHGCPITQQVDDDYRNRNEDIRKTNTTVPVDAHDHRIDMCDLSRSLLESMVVGEAANESVVAISSNEQSDEEEHQSESQSEVDDQFEILSDIEERSVLRDSIELDERLSNHILASSSHVGARESAKPAPTTEDASATTSKSGTTEAMESTSSSSRVGDTSELEAIAPTSEIEPMKVSSTEHVPKRQQKPDEGAVASTDGKEEKEPVRESSRESVARKRAQMKLLAKESVASKRAKAMLKFQEMGKGPCISDNCRTRGSFESEEQELDRLLKAEEEREAKERERPDKCVGFMTREFDKTAFKPSLYMNLYKEPITVRRVRRKPAQPAASKKEAKPNKTSDLRYKYLHNQKVVSSNAAEHMKKFKRPPFKNPSQFGHSCSDRPAHFGIQRETKEMEKQIKIARETDSQLLQGHQADPGSATAGRAHATAAK